MKPGVYADLSNADYHGGDGVSKSMLDVLADKSPLHLYHLRSAANDNARQPTPSQELGTAFHALLLEPDVFTREYCLALRPQDVPDAIEGREALVAMVEELNKGRQPKLPTTGTKDEMVARIMDALPAEQRTPEVQADLQAMAGKELKAQLDALNETRHGLLPTTGTIPALAQLLRDAGRPVTLWSDVKAEWLANNGHRKVLEPETWEQLHNMRAAVMAHPAAYALLNGSPGRAEQSVYWMDPATGELCRCRPDWWREDGIVVDLKTTQDASPEGFARSMEGWRYHVQEAMYRDGITIATGKEPRAFVFLAVETTARVVNGQAMGVAVYVLDKESVDLGRALYRQDLGVYSQCRRTDIWPGYGDKIQPIKLPGYAFTKNAHLLGAA